MMEGARIAALLIVLVSFSGAGAADTIVRGTVILISSDMYTIKTESGQGFGGSRETFYVDPTLTKKTGEIKVGTIVEAEVGINGAANWVKAVEGTKKPVAAVKKPVEGVKKPVKGMKKPIKGAEKPVKGTKKPAGK